MAAKPTRSTGEHLSKTGEVFLSYKHISLLHGLMDRPQATAGSINDWLVASFPYARRYRSYMSVGMLQKAIRTMNGSWIDRKRVGRCVRVKLLPRGRGIIDRTVAARIRGYGAYVGLPKVGRS